MPTLLRLSFLMLVTIVSACGGGGGHTHTHTTPQPEPAHIATPAAPAIAAASCFNQLADDYPCNNVDLLGGLIFTVQGSDIWGWQDTVNGDDYALVGLTTGTAFVRVTNPAQPTFIAFLPTATANSSWRDIKVINDHALIVSEANGHGLQIVNLQRLATMTSLQTITADALYTSFGDAHNVAVNEDSGFAFVTGSNTCNGGLHMIDMSTPLTPVFAGCFSADGYTHDVQCATYWGDDSDYRGKEICFAANEDTLTVVDVTDKAAPIQVARLNYPNTAYAHQGWLSEDHNTFFMGDELDEQRRNQPTRTLIWDTRDLDAITLTREFSSNLKAIDHNMYMHGNHLYQANYTAGIRILRSGNLQLGELSEVGYFDTWPANDNATFDGTWSVFPFFDSGIVVTANIDGRFFVLQPNLSAVPECDDGLDNDSDGDTDFPADISCTSANTAFEN